MSKDTRIPAIRHGGPLTALALPPVPYVASPALTGERRLCLELLLGGFRELAGYVQHNCEEEKLVDELIDFLLTREWLHTFTREDPGKIKIVIDKILQGEPVPTKYRASRNHSRVWQHRRKEAVE